MKKLFLALVICLATSFAANAQTTPLNKQQTLDYLNKQYRKFNDNFDSLFLDNKVLVQSFKGGTSFRLDVSELGNLVVKMNEHSGSGVDVRYKPNRNVFYGIDVESDAIRLKKALEHLIDLLKAEKSTDPFDN